HAAALRRLRDAGGPGVSVEIGAVEIGLAAEALPARDRHHRLIAVAVGLGADGEAFGPRSAETLFRLGDGAAIADIDAEEAEFQPVRAEKRISRRTRIILSHGGRVCGRSTQRKGRSA